MTEQQPLELDCEERTITRRVFVKLNHIEKAQTLDDICGIDNEISDAEKLFEEQKSRHRANLAELEAKISALKQRAKEGEPRDVQCTEKRFFAENLVQVWNGGDMIEERAMTPEERQMSMGPVFTPDEVCELEENVDPEQDLKDTMHEERSRTKPSLVDMR